MTRGQRALHRRIFSILPLLLLAALALAFMQRRAAREHLQLKAARPAAALGGAP